MKDKTKVIVKVVVLVILLGWIIMVFTDYFRVREEKEPLFCISKKENKYDDGTTTVCTSIGYKVIKYDRECLSASEFGPFIIKEKICDSK